LIKISNTIQNYFLKRKLEEIDDNNDTHVDVDDEPMSLNTERLNPVSISSKLSTYYLLIGYNVHLDFQDMIYAYTFFCMMIIIV